jgi:transcriptional regulator with XRE-family HTH domain
MEKLKDIISRLESSRIEQKLSYEQVAEMINSSRSNVWKVLTSLTVPNGETLIKLCNALGFEFIIKPIISLNDIARGDMPDLVHKEFIENKLNKVKIQKDKVEKVKKESKKIPELKKKVIQPKECDICTYSELKSGIKIVVKKCDDCKRLKK